MNSTSNNLSDSQLQRLAHLMVNFSSDTANLVLNRFDKGTRSRIQEHMESAAISDDRDSTERLNEFAEFLYFQPDNSGKTLPARQTAPHREDRAARMTNRPSLTFQDVLGFSDVSLELLLKAAPPELTISVLTCCPESFVRRVLAKLSAAEAREVQQKLNRNTTVDFADMQKIHQRYCDFATYMIDNGLMTDQYDSNAPV